MALNWAGGDYDSRHEAYVGSAAVVAGVGCGIGVRIGTCWEKPGLDASGSCAPSSPQPLDVTKNSTRNVGIG